MIQLIFLFCVYPTLFLMYFVQKGEGKAKHSTLFGIKYSNEWLSGEEVAQLESNYRRTMNRYLLVFALIPAVTFFIPYVSISFTIWMLWMTAVIIMFMIPFVKNYNKLLKLKEERCPQENAEEVIYAEMKNAGIIRRVKWQQFIAPCALSAILAIFSFIYFSQHDLEVYGALIIIFALCTFLFYACAVWMDRGKTKVISSNSDVNVNYTRARKNIFKNFWMKSAWLNIVFLFILMIAMIMEADYHIKSFHVMIWSVVIYSVIEMVLCMRMARAQQALARKYAKKMDINIDDEKHWIGGILYYNPKDKHTMVDKHLGTGTTMNLATPAGQAFTVFTVLAFLSIPIICIWMILLEFVPISLFVEDDVLIARHLRNDYVIETDTITELTLEDELPRTSKVSGTGMDNLLKGNFRNSVDGRIEIFLNPENQYYLRIVSEDTIYYLAGYDDEETLEIYETLSNK